MYRHIRALYKSAAGAYPLNGKGKGRLVMSESKKSILGNRMVWVIDRKKHGVIAVVFDANKAMDPLVLTMSSSIDRIQYLREMKKRMLRRE